MNKADKTALSYLISMACHAAIWIAMFVAAWRGQVVWVLFSGFVLLNNQRSLDLARAEFLKVTERYR